MGWERVKKEWKQENGGLQNKREEGGRKEKKTLLGEIRKDFHGELNDNPVSGLVLLDDGREYHSDVPVHQIGIGRGYGRE